MCSVYIRVYEYIYFAPNTFDRAEQRTAHQYIPIHKIVLNLGLGC